MRNTPEKCNEAVESRDSRHSQSVLRLVICMVLTSVSPNLSTAQSLTGRSTHSPRPPCHSHLHYAGQCDVRDPCAHYNSGTVRYGDDRDFECFIVDES